MTYSRQFAPLPAGYLNTTDINLVIETGFLNTAADVYTPIGLGVVRTGIQAAQRPIVNLPTSDTQKLYGILIINDSAYRAPNQPNFTEVGQNFVKIVRNTVNVRVWTATAITINDPVFLHFAAGADRGKFRANNAGSVGIAVPNARWKSEVSAAGVAELELTLG